MKIIAIGDIHWRDCWKQIVEQEYDKVIFMWDYFDTFKKLSPAQQLTNFLEIVELKNNNWDKVIMLLGNHDYHYLPTTDAIYSGFQPIGKTIFWPEIWDWIHSLTIEAAWQRENFLFTHAWLSSTRAEENMYWPEFKDGIHNNLNVLLLNEPDRFWFYPWDISRTGNNKHQSPIRIRPEALNEDMFWEYTQIVWHTTVKDIDINDPIVQIDALESWQYLIIQDGNLSIWYLSWAQ